VRCWVKSRNERNPRPLLLPDHAGHSEGTAPVNGEEGEDDVKSSWPLCPGLHTCYNGQDKGSLLREEMPIPKTWSQFGWLAATRQPEAGIRSRALYTPPVTPRKLRVPEVADPTSSEEGGAEGVRGDWGEVVTR
jgi:hypothetical protein